MSKKIKKYTRNMAYKLSDVLRGHEMDVRGVCRSVFPPRGLISVSRDRSTRVWKKDEFSKQFIESQCFSGHQGFVAAVCTVPQSDKYPYGRAFILNSSVFALC